VSRSQVGTSRAATGAVSTRAVLAAVGAFGSAGIADEAFVQAGNASAAHRSGKGNSFDFDLDTGASEVKRLSNIATKSCNKLEAKPAVTQLLVAITGQDERHQLVIN
jgi:hypothetical protein